MNGWNEYVYEQSESDLNQIIKVEKLKTEETHVYRKAFREGEVKTVGTVIDKIIPPVSRFDGDCARKKQ